MQFVIRKGNKIDEQIAKIIQKNAITIPIVPIRAGLYLIGTNRANIDFKFNQILVKVGGGSEKLENYIIRNERQMK